MAEKVAAYREQEEVTDTQAEARDRKTRQAPVTITNMTQPLTECKNKIIFQIKWRRTYYVFEIRVENASVCCSVASDGPRIQDNLLRIEAQFVDSILHNDVDCVALVIRKRLTLQNINNRDVTREWSAKEIYNHVNINRASCESGMVPTENRVTSVKRCSRRSNLVVAGVTFTRDHLQAR